MAGEHELEIHRAGLLQGRQVGEQRLRAGPVVIALGLQRPGEQRVGGYAREQVVRRDQQRAALVPEDGVRGAVAGSAQDSQRALAQFQVLPLGEGAIDLHGAAPRAEARRDGPQCGDDVGGNPVAQHDAPGEAVVELGLRAEVAQPAIEALQGGHLCPRASREDRGEAEVVDVLMGDDQELEVLDRVPARGEGPFELVQRLRRVGPRVDQREGLVLDQVRVDAPHREGRGYRKAVDPLPSGPLQRGGRSVLVLLGVRFLGSLPGGGLGGCAAAGAHERITASTSSRRRSMSCRERSDSRQRRSSGSVLEGRTLKCQSS